MKQLHIPKSITPHENAVLEKYLKDINKIPLITREEEYILAEKIQQGDQKALEKLVNANLRFVISVAKQYQNQGLSLPDLINEGNLGLIKAAQRFDPSKECKFISYAVWRIRQTILGAIAEQGKMIKLPINKHGEYHKLEKIISHIEQKTQRQITKNDLVDLLLLKEEEIPHYDLFKKNILSFESSIFHDDLDATTLEDITPTPESKDAFDYIFRNQSLHIELMRIIKKILTQQERRVLILHFGINGPMYTLEQIATDLNISKERVRQLKEKALMKIRRSSYLKNLKQYL